MKPKKKPNADPAQIDLDFLIDFYNLETKREKVFWGIIVERSAKNGTTYKPGLFIEDAPYFLSLYERKFETPLALSGYEREIQKAERVSAGKKGEYMVLTTSAGQEVILPSTFVQDIHRFCRYSEEFDNPDTIWPL